MPLVPFSARGVWVLACGLAVLACPAAGWAQTEGDQENNFQNILRDVTGAGSSENAPVPAGEDGSPESAASSSDTQAAPSWEGEDVPVQAAPQPPSAAAPAPSPAPQVAPPQAEIMSSPETGAQTPLPVAPGAWSPETGAPIAGIIPLPEPPPAFLDRSSVKLQTLDKATARTMTFEARVSSTVQFGPLFIKVRACRSPPPEERKESAAFLQIWENEPRSGDPKWIFSGWMFGSSPALSSMDHPIYDVWVISCIEDAVESQTPSVPEED